MKRHLFLIAFLFAASTAHAEDDQSNMKQMVIVESTKQYEAAMKTAAKAAAHFKLPLQMEGLSANETTGLTYSKAECKKQLANWPCYDPRGPSDDGAFVSVEYSSAFVGWNKGYYVVIITHAYSGDPVIEATLKRAKKLWPDAYTKSTEVYVGCSQ